MPKGSSNREPVVPADVLERVQAYAFGPYRLEVPLRRLLRAGEPVPLTPKAFDVLLALIERRDRVVDKAELMKLVWPDSFVEEANLSQTIFMLRKTLGESADGQLFIETMPRRGYRFTADVRVEVAKPAVAAESRPLAGVTLRWLLPALAITVAAIGAAAILWVTRDRRIEADPLAVRTRVAVLPFENLTGNRADDWLASALSDSLTSGLQRVENLISVSRDRIIELYREQGIREGAAVDASILRRLSQDLGVRYYVHGSYQHMEGEIKVVARLVDVEAGTNHAQETVVDELKNLLALEDDLADRFAAKLAPGQRMATSGPQTSSLEAYRAVVEARPIYVAQQFKDSSARLEHAISLDPRYAEAWALLAKARARMAAPGSYSVGFGSIRELREGALIAAQRAVELDPSLYDAHIALALAHRETEQSAPWRAEAEKAVALNPGLPEGFALLGDWYGATPSWGCARGFDTALSETHYRTALRLDRRFVTAWGNLVNHLVWAGRANEAIRIAGEALEVVPDHPGLRRDQAMALLFASRIPEAEAELQKLSNTDRGGSVYYKWLRATIALKRGDAATAEREFATILATISDTAYEFRVALSYFFAGRPEDAVRHIERAVQRSPECTRFAAVSTAFAPYRDTPQFKTRLAGWQK